MRIHVSVGIRFYRLGSKRFDEKGNEGESLCRLSLGGVVYHMWMQRNNIKDCNQPRTEEEIVKRIIWEIRV